MPVNSMALAADALVLLHLAFVVFVVVGGLLVVRWPVAAWLHVPAVAWGVWIELTAGICPLTPLENRWRQAAMDAGAQAGTPYEGGFIDHYVMPVLYPPGLTPAVQVSLGVGLAVWTVAVYAVAWWAWRRRQRQGEAQRVGRPAASR